MTGQADVDAGQSTDGQIKLFLQAPIPGVINTVSAPEATEAERPGQSAIWRCRGRVLPCLLEEIV